MPQSIDKYQKDPIVNKKIQVMYPTSSNYRSSSRQKMVGSPSEFRKNSQSYVYVQKPNRGNFQEPDSYRNYLQYEDAKSPFQTNLRHSVARSYQSEHYSNHFDNFQSQVQQNLNKLSRKTTSYLPTSQIISHKLPTNQYPSFQKHKEHQFNIETLSNKSSSRIRQMNEKIDQTTKNILKNGMIRKSSHKKYEQFMAYDPRSSESLHKRKSSHERLQSSEKRRPDPRQHNDLFIYSNQRERSNEKPKISQFSRAQRPNYGIEYSTNMMDTKLYNPYSYRPEKDSKSLSSNYQSSQIVSPLPQYNLVDSVTRNINSLQNSTKSNPFIPPQLNFDQNYNLPSTNSKRKDITFNNINFKHSSTRQPNRRVSRQNDGTETNRDRYEFQFKLMQEQNGKSSYRKLKPTDLFITSPSNRYQDHKYQDRPIDFGNNFNFNAFQSLKSPQFSNNYNLKHEHNSINFSSTHIPQNSSLNSKNIHFSRQQQINFKKSDSFQQDFDFLNENQRQNPLNRKKPYDFTSNISANQNEQFEFKDFSDDENDPFQAINSYENLQTKKVQPISMVPENKFKQMSQKNTNFLNQKSKQFLTNQSTQKQNSAIVSPLRMQEAIQPQVNSSQKPNIMKKYISHMTDKQSKLIAIVLIVLAFVILILQLVS